MIIFVLKKYDLQINTNGFYENLARFVECLKLKNCFERKYSVAEINI